MAYLVPRYDASLVVASVLIATLAAYVMLHFANRVHTVDRATGRALLMGGSVAMGTGIWSMHFVGMLAYSLPIQLGYTRSLTALSWLASVAACLVALQVASRVPTLPRLAAGSLAMGLAICAMHYIGMAALDMAPGIVWNRPLVALSVVVAIGTSAAALVLFFGLRRVSARRRLACQLAASVVMGLATSGMHYTGMAAVQLPEGAVCLSANALGGNGLGVLVLLAASTMLGMALLISVLDKRMQRRTSQVTESLEATSARLRSVNAALRRHATIDPLTGLPNRPRFEDRLRRAVARESGAARPDAAWPQAGLAVLFIDLDRFRLVNDVFGHAAGDTVLKEVASRLRGTARRRDIVARVGGDAFLLLMEDVVDKAECLALAQRLIDAVEQPFDLPGRQVPVSASIGIAVYPDHGQPDQLVAHADAAMHAAKRCGVGTFAMFDPGMAGESLDELDLLTDLREAVKRGQLTLHYQPKVDARSGQLRGVEALLRWQHPTRGFVSPERFIPIAERFGLIVSLGNWVIDEACRQIQDWAAAGLEMRVAINVSAHQLRNGDIAVRIAQALARHQVMPSQLLCEITESVAMEDILNTQVALERLEQIGVFLAIDDFGTGYSSLAYLRQLPAQQLKIDRSFVRDLVSSPDARAIVDAVIRLAHALGLSVVAEGVETAGQGEVLRGFGCDELQGYFFARPMPADALLIWARAAMSSEPAEHRPLLLEAALSG